SFEDWRKIAEKPDHRHRLLLRAHGNRQRHGRAAEQDKDITPPHSLTFVCRSRFEGRKDSAAEGVRQDASIEPQSAGREGVERDPSPARARHSSATPCRPLSVPNELAECLNQEECASDQSTDRQHPYQQGDRFALSRFDRKRLTRPGLFQSVLWEQEG